MGRGILTESEDGYHEPLLFSVGPFFLDFEDFLTRIVRLRWDVQRSGGASFRADAIRTCETGHEAVDVTVRGTHG